MRIVLYSRRGCHLCERAEDLLLCHRPAAEVVDVDATAELAARYGLRVPVLEVDGVAVLEGGFDARSLVARLDNAASGLRGPPL
jgi:glutaredoxin